jgi:PGF-CTERM protein
VSRQLYPDRYDDSVYVPRSAVEGATPATVTEDTSGGSGPGFTAVGAVLALVGAALLARRRQ